MRNTEVKMRHPTHNIHSLILNRWSPRSMTAEGITDEDFMGTFEAARWGHPLIITSPGDSSMQREIQNIGSTLQPFG
ncbi:MAG: hypothetical protein WAM14_00675 [Candidatus Nitrosopolaris sp.]